MKLSPYQDWLGAVYIETENILGCTTSDAQGVVDAKPFELSQSWALNRDALQTAEAILGEAGKTQVRAFSA